MIDYAHSEFKLKSVSNSSNEQSQGARRVNGVEQMMTVVPLQTRFITGPVQAGRHDRLTVGDDIFINRRDQLEGS